MVPLNEPDPLAKVAHHAELAVLRPGISLVETRLLAHCPYELSRAVSTLPDELRKRVPAMVRAKLLEVFNDGNRVKLVRCTALGIDVVQAFARGGFLGPEFQKKWALVGQRLLGPASAT